MKTGLCFGVSGFGVTAAFSARPGAFVKLVLGMAVFLTGAVGIEELSNFVIPGSSYDILENFVEEVVFEMVGSTIVLWGSFEFTEPTRILVAARAVNG